MTQGLRDGRDSRATGAGRRLVDELQINLVPVLLGSGVRMFDELGGYPIELSQHRVIESSAVTHLRYRVRQGS